MIGSDWPVCTLSGDYAAVMGIVLDYIGQFPIAVREDILGGNCAVRTASSTLNDAHLQLMTRGSHETWLGIV